MFRLSGCVLFALRTAAAARLSWSVGFVAPTVEARTHVRTHVLFSSHWAFAIHMSLSEASLNVLGFAPVCFISGGRSTQTLTATRSSLDVHRMKRGSLGRCGWAVGFSNRRTGAVDRSNCVIPRTRALQDTLATQRETKTDRNMKHFCLHRVERGSTGRGCSEEECLSETAALVPQTCDDCGPTPLISHTWSPSLDDTRTLAVECKGLACTASGGGNWSANRDAATSTVFSSEKSHQLIWSLMLNRSLQLREIMAKTQDYDRFRTEQREQQGRSQNTSVRLHQTDHLRAKRGKGPDIGVRPHEAKQKRHQQEPRTQDYDNINSNREQTRSQDTGVRPHEQGNREQKQCRQRTRSHQTQRREANKSQGHRCPNALVKAIWRAANPKSGFRQHETKQANAANKSSGHGSPTAFVQYGQEQARTQGTGVQPHEKAIGRKPAPTKQNTRDHTGKPVEHMFRLLAV